jgi:hypothetical protein
MAREHELHVGTAVAFRFGSHKMQGTVREDRGPIGKGGRRLYLIKFFPQPSDESAIELPADEIELLRHAPR